MKKLYTLLSIFFVISLIFGCTKERDFLEKPTFIRLNLSVTSPDNIYEMWLEDSLLQDTINQARPLNKRLNPGEHRLRIRQKGQTSYLLDSVFNMVWMPSEYKFSIIELDPNENPLFFTGFPDSLPEVKPDVVVFSILNVDNTLTKGKEIDLLFYDQNAPEKLIMEMKNISYNKISNYYTMSGTDFTLGGYMVIKESNSGEVLFDSKTIDMIVGIGNYYPGASNTYILKFSNRNDVSYPVYNFESVFDMIR